ncbi:MAG: efflux RND transporter permease subunit [Candidatus Omnitrophica bacterium]|nr:efflux RND transporter permease subunit [Candidatus Omnitrophota bacterium]
MNFTDLFIKRPVLAIVVSLFILVLGIRAVTMLGVREYPETQNAVVTVMTVYTGADPELVAGFITTPLENSIAQANGIDYLTSSSASNVSMIKANLRLNYDPNKALTEINTKVNAVLNQLPRDAQQPSITLSIGETTDSMYMGFYSKVLPANKITDYLIRVVQPKLQTVPGVQTAEILGKRQFALRAWLDPQKMAAYGLTAADVTNSLAANNFIAAVGRTKGQMISVDLTAATGLRTVDEFRDLILKQSNGAIVRLGDVANVTLGAEDYDTSVVFDGEGAVFIGIKVAPSANLLTVIAGVRKIFPEIQQQFPQGLEGRIVYDATEYINSSIQEVVKTLVEALLIVTLVIFLFLGSIRSVIIPTLAMPLSLIGTFFVMFLLGYTINLLTLLALVLAIGLVVDDAIIVVENAHRHIEEGATPLNAALQGARELAGPIVAISIVLIAVYIPIGFMGGLTGALFTEFAYTLAGAVAVSAVIALTLSPMMCSRMFKSGKPGKFAGFIDRKFDQLKSGYGKALKVCLNSLPVVAVFAVLIFAGIYYLYTNSKSELAPPEDQGFIISFYSANPTATLQQTKLYSGELFSQVSVFPEMQHVFQIDGFNGLNSGIVGMVLKPWAERKRSSFVLQAQIQKKLSRIAGLNGVAFLPPPLPGGGEGLPLQYVIGTTDSFGRLNDVAQAFLAKAYATGYYMYLDSDLKIDKPQAEIWIDKDKAGQMGLSMRDIGGNLGAMLGGGYVNYFNLAGRSYKVIPQVSQASRLNPEQLKNYYLRTANGSMISLATVAKIKTTVVPESLSHFQQLNSATISGITAPGITLGEAIKKLDQLAKQVLPQGYGVDYAGQTRQYAQESNALLITFFFAMLIIFLALAALFESFRDPLIVLISVPMSICGALIFINLGVKGASLNIYTQVGLVTLIGLISKHGILIVQFANDLMREGKTKRQAVEMAAAIRLRPILMTTAAMVLGVLPLVMASGAGAAGRFNMGLVIVSGISIGTLFTLFVVPAMYMFLAKEHGKVAEDAIS